MKIRVNGADQAVESSAITIADLLALNHVEVPEMVAVQRNGNFVPKEQYGETPVTDGDEIEFLYYMGGGGTSP